MDIGRSIKRMRKSRGLSQEKLAEKLGCSTGHISAVESGRADPSLTLITLIASIFRMPVAELFSENLTKRQELLSHISAVLPNDADLNLLSDIARVIAYHRSAFESEEGMTT